MAAMYLLLVVAIIAAIIGGIMVVGDWPMSTKYAIATVVLLLCFALGVMYYAGHGVPQAMKMSWYRLAADQGNATGQASLGAMYANGQGVPQNYTEAMKWYRLSV